MTDTAEPTALALFPKLNLPSVTGITEEMNKSFGTMYTRIEEGIRKLPTDMTVKANREAVASYAYQIARTKTGLDKAAADVSGDAKQIVDAVNSERRQLKDTLDTLRDKARAKLDAWEDAQKAKAERADRELHELSCIRVDVAGLNSGELQTFLGNLKAMDAPTEAMFGEQAEDVLRERQHAAEYLDRLISEEQKREREAAELEQLRAEKAAREEADRLAAEKKAAEEEAAAQAERDRIAAEQKAEADRIAREQIAAEAAATVAAMKVTNYNTALSQFARMIERAANTPSGYIADFIERLGEMDFTDDAYPADKIGELWANHTETVAKLQTMAVDRVAEEQEAAEREIIRRKEEAKRHEAAVAEAAAQHERARIAAEKAEEDRLKLAQERADQERAADLAHRKKINTAALAALVKVSEISEDQAKMIITAIAKGQVPHVVITY